MNNRVLEIDKPTARPTRRASASKPASFVISFCFNIMRARDICSRIFFLIFLTQHVSKTFSLSHLLTTRHNKCFKATPLAPSHLSPSSSGPARCTTTLNPSRNRTCTRIATSGNRRARRSRFLSFRNQSRRLLLRRRRLIKARTRKGIEESSGKEEGIKSCLLLDRLVTPRRT